MTLKEERELKKAAKLEAEKQRIEAMREEDRLQVLLLQAQ